MSLEKTIYIGQLFSFYKSLLTEKQRDMLSLYYEEDFSLSEIAEQFNISRQGVHDNIKRGEKSLKIYEDSLHMNEKRLERLELLHQLSEVITETDGLDVINQLKQLED